MCHGLVLQTTAMSALPLLQKPLRSKLLSQMQCRQGTVQSSSGQTHKPSSQLCLRKISSSTSKAFFVIFISSEDPSLFLSHLNLFQDFEMLKLILLQNQLCMHPWICKLLNFNESMVCSKKKWERRKMQRKFKAAKLCGTHTIAKFNLKSSDKLGSKSHPEHCSSQNNEISHELWIFTKLPTLQPKYGCRELFWRNAL